MSDVAIGIDLGTTYSVVAVYKKDHMEIIHNQQGQYTTPSCVSFTKEGRLVGEPAKDKALLDPDNTISGVKRFLGRTYDDPEFQSNLLSFTYRIIDVKNKPMIEVEQMGQTKRYAPEEISAIILEYMKELAETYLGETITKAIITVPAHFNDAQRQATKDAGRIAGLEVMRIINEPTAAALAYGLHNKYKDKEGTHTILIYDFGGGTFDVSIIAIQGELLEVKATNGEAYLGGDDIDFNLTNHFIEEFKKNNGIDLRKNKKAVRRIRHKCEHLKKSLSFADSGNIDIDVIHTEGENSYDFSAVLSRKKLEQINSKLFDKTIDCVKKTLKDANLKRNQIDEIVLVGGSSRIPRVKDLVQKFFNKELNASLNPDEAVARGAAIQAAIMTDSNSNTEIGLLLFDVNPLTLGIETIGGEMSPIIPRNTKIPTKRTELYVTSVNFIEEMDITVYEGEGSLVHRNRKLGEFRITGLPPRPRGQVTVEVTFEINVDGILNVTAVEIDGKIKNELQIDSRKGHLTEEEIKRMIAEAEKYREYDENVRKKIKAKVSFQQFVSDLCDELMQLDMEGEDLDTCKSTYEEAFNWIEENEATKEECERKKIEICGIVDPILQKYDE